MPCGQSVQVEEIKRTGFENGSGRDVGYLWGGFYFYSFVTILNLCHNFFYNAKIMNVKIFG